MKYPYPLSVNYKDIKGLIDNLQIASELEKFIDIYREVKPNGVLEIGTCFGGTLYYFIKYAQPNAKIVALDKDHYRLKSGFFNTDIDSSNVNIVELDSHSPDTQSYIASLGEFQFIFIDADHTYDGAKADWDYYSKLVKKGVIILHDIHNEKMQESEGWGVYKLWQEIKQTEPDTEEFIDNILSENTCCGLGIVWRK